MNTFPNHTYDGHIKRFLDYLEEIDPVARKMNLLFFYEGAVEYDGDILKVPRNAIFDLVDFKTKFKQLVAEGREWLNISASGRLTEKNYAVSFEYSASMGKTMTAVNISGPPLNINGSIQYYCSYDFE